ncbi:MAG: SAM-dependent methyltransferase [Candidatus Hydrogenedentes bacterium]|nr:SAM-dependent methyltransferase [Candidatus Hydrogenedentota bacterium]
MPKKTFNKWQYGDFQTPESLVGNVLHLLKEKHGTKPALVIEPTCGKGAFIRGALQAFQTAIIKGFDVNPAYVDEARRTIPKKDMERVSIEQGDFFLVDWNRVLNENRGDILILGNPPWVTSSELGLINSRNLPEKTNFQGQRGIEAITGSGNFDISEWMILQHVDWLSRRAGTLAMLCKYSVARKIVRRMRQNKVLGLFGSIYLIDAKQHFSASVEACLFVLATGGEHTGCGVYGSLESLSPDYSIGARDGHILRNVDLYASRRNLRGHDVAYVWRSGIKHDCSKVMELEYSTTGLRNGFGNVVPIEDTYVYPLLKSSDIGNSRVNMCRKYIIVPQTYVGEDTAGIKRCAPRTWAYLESYARQFTERRSSIYKNKPPYAIFGVGDYTFRPWKVAISGLYKRLAFCVVGPIDGKTVIFDDTVNFLSFKSQEEALFIYELLLSKPATEFYESMIFWDEKRPITTQILKRLSLRAVAEELGRDKEYRHFLTRPMMDRNGQLQLGLADDKRGYIAKRR